MSYETIAITGGKGFLGTHLLSLIPKYLAQSRYYNTSNDNHSTMIVKPTLVEIRMLDINLKQSILDQSQKIAINLADKNNSNLDITVRWIEADIRNYKDLCLAFEGVSAVIHLASLIDGSNKVMNDVNFLGTRNVIKACMTCGVIRLIYTSTIDVTVGFGKTVGHGLYLSELEASYPKIHLFPRYGVTKMKAEMEVIKWDNCQLNNNAPLRTLCLRPTAMYGPGDPHFVTKALMRGDRGLCPNFLGIGRLKSQLFPVTEVGDALFQATYIKNVAWAHLKALDSISLDPETCGGEIFFICDETPVLNVYQFVKPFFLARGIAYHHNPLPKFMVTLMNKISYVLLYCLPWLGAVFPIEISAFLYLYANHLVSYDKAKKYLDYRPIYTFEESMVESIAFYKSLCLTPTLKLKN